MKNLIYMFIIMLFCNAHASGQGPGYIWVKGATGTNSENAKDIAVDVNGNSYVIGAFESTTLIFGNDTLTNPNFMTDQVFIVKHDASGNVIWARSAGGIDYSYGNGIAVDDIGNLYITGWTISPTITFDSITINGSGAFIAKYDTSGNVQWARCSSGNENNKGTDVTIDANGNAIMTGQFVALVPVTFGTITLTSPYPGGVDIFIVKYDPSGNAIWAKRADGNGDEFINGITIDPAGNTYITGSYHGDSIAFDTITLMNSSGYQDEVFVAKYDLSGNVTWAKSFAGSGYDYGYCIAIDASSNLFISGSFESPSITFGSVTLMNAGGTCPPNNSCTDIFLVKLDSSGAVQWATSAGGNKDDNGFGIAANPAGEVYITGDFKSDTIIFGTITLVKTGVGSDCYITKYSAAGNVLWAQRAGGWASDLGNAVATDGQGYSYLTGSFLSSQVVFGSIVMVNSGSEDFFLAKLDNTTGIAEHNNTFNTIYVFPNPANGEITIEYAGTIDEIETRDVSGQIIYSAKPNKPTIILKPDDDGIYFVTVRSGKELVTRKIVVH